MDQSSVGIIRDQAIENQLGLRIWPMRLSKDTSRQRVFALTAEKVGGNLFDVLKTLEYPAYRASEKTFHF